MVVGGGIGFSFVIVWGAEGWGGAREPDLGEEGAVGADLGEGATWYERGGCGCWVLVEVFEAGE